MRVIKQNALLLANLRQQEKATQLYDLSET